MELKKVKFKPFLHENNLLNLSIYKENKFNTRKQARAFLIANLAYFLDTISLTLSIENFFKKDKHKNISFIHNCFTVTCINIEIKLLQYIYYKSFFIEFLLKSKNLSLLNSVKIVIYKKTNLTTINNDKEKTIKFNYPDINKVLKLQHIDFKNSSYFINFLKIIYKIYNY